MVKLEVKVVGFPKPETKWVKDGSELFASEEYQIENLEDGTSILVINDVYPDDTGEIKFEAYNTLGVAETVTQFVVEGTFITDHQHNNNIHILLLFNNLSNQFNDFFQQLLKYLQSSFKYPFLKCSFYVLRIVLLQTIFFRLFHCF